jgi:hypothetical protein
MGGSAELDLTPKAKQLIDTNGKNILNSLIFDTKEKYETISNDISNYTLPYYQIVESASRGAQVSRFLERFNFKWRVNSSGNIEIIENTGELETPTQVSLIDCLADGSLILKTNKLDKEPKPGIYNNEQFNEIIIDVDANSLILTLYKTSFKEVFDDFIWRKTKQTVQQSFIALVDSQNADGTLKLVPQNKQVKGGGLTNVPIGYGGANFSQTNIPQNTKVIVQYSESDPSKNYVSAIFFDDIDDSISIYGNPSSAQFVALSNLVDARIQRLVDFINNELVLSTGVGPTSPGAVTPIEDQNSVACEKLKSE